MLRPAASTLRRALAVTLTFAVASGGPLAARPLAAQDLGIQVGAQAPGAPIETLDGKTVDLGTIIAGKATLLEFWASWCGNCRLLEPAMTAAHAKYKDRVQFVTVAVSLNQTVEQVKAYQARHKVPGTFLYDRRGDASEAYDAPATSFVVIIDKAGKVVYTGVGGRQALDAALAKVATGS